MIRIYREHPEFGQYTRFDTTVGRLEDITQMEFEAVLSAGQVEPTTGGDPIVRVETGEAAVFTGETPATHTRFPRRIYFQITRNCNLTCPYCFLSSGPGKPHVPLAAVKDVAAFTGRCGLTEVRLTGGEPTTHPDFFEIVDAFQANNVYVSVATNGVLSERVLEGLAARENLWLICSIDGDRETHNRYRPGTYDTIVGNLRRLRSRRASLRLRLTTVLTTANMNQVRKLGELTQSLGAESITIIPLRPQTRDLAASAEMVTAGQFRKVIEDMVAVMDETGVRMTTTLATDMEDYIHKDPIVRKRSSCAAGREAANLDYDARTGRFLVYGCSYSPAGDLDAEPEMRRPFLAGEFPADGVSDFLDIWRDERAWAIYRDPAFKWSQCHDCEYFKSHRCVGSCPIQNVDYSALNLDGDVLDQLKHQFVRTGEWYCYAKIFQE